MRCFDPEWAKENNIDINLQCSDIIESFQKFVNVFSVLCILGMENPDK